MQSILTGFRLCNSLALCCVFFSCNKTPKKVNYLRGFELGTTYNIQYISNLPQLEVQKGIDSIFYIINKSLSTYLPHSDISKINEGDTSIVVDHHFRAVFEKATEVWRATGGYFDPTVGALVNAYGFGPEKSINDLNTKQKDSLLSLTGWHKVKLMNDHTIEKESPLIYLDFNALAKGYAADVIGNYLYQLGHKSYMVEIGGEVVTKGKSPKTGQDWKIAIEDPIQNVDSKFLQTLTLNDEALASSGNYRKYRIDTITNERFVHSINPLTGSAKKTKILSTSVKAPDCITADAWATALMVMSLEKGKILIDNDPELEALWTLANHDKFLVIESKNW